MVGLCFSTTEWALDHGCFIPGLPYEIVDSRKGLGSIQGYRETFTYFSVWMPGEAIQRPGRQSFRPDVLCLPPTWTGLEGSRQNYCSDFPFLFYTREGNEMLPCIVPAMWLQEIHISISREKGYQLVIRPVETNGEKSQRPWRLWVFTPSSATEPEFALWVLLLDLPLLISTTQIRHFLHGFPHLFPTTKKWTVGIFPSHIPHCIRKS